VARPGWLAAQQAAERDRKQAWRMVRVLPLVVVVVLVIVTLAK
jgi:hypothetical protein